MTAGVRELWTFRDVVAAFTQRYVAVRYKQTALGVAWALLQPIAAAAVLAVIVNRVAGFPTDGIPTLLFVLAGTVAWTYFSTGAGSAVESLLTDRDLVRKVYFPREAIPLAAVAAGLVDLGPGLGLLIVVAVASGAGIGIELIALVVPVLTLIAIAAAVGLVFSALNAYYRDFRYVLPYGFQLGMFLTPVFYPLSLLPGEWRDAYAIANPVASAIEAIRDIVGQGDWPDPVLTLGGLGWALVLLLLSYAAFKQFEPELADRL